MRTSTLAHTAKAMLAPMPELRRSVASFAVVMSGTAIAVPLILLLTHRPAEQSDSLIAMQVLGLLIGTAAGVTLLIAAISSRAWAICAYLVLVVVAINLSFRSRGFDDISLDRQVGIKLLVFAGALGIGLVSLPRTFDRLVRPPGLWVVLYAAWATVSVTYSVTPMLSLGAVFTLWSFLLFSAAANVRLSAREILYGIAGPIAALVLASWIVYIVWPDVGSSIFWPDAITPVRRMTGILGHPNTLGHAAALLGGLAMIAPAYTGLRLRFVAAPVILAIATIGATESRTALAAMVVGVAMVYGRYRHARIMAVIVATAAVVTLLYSGLTRTGRGLDSLFAHLSRNGSSQEIYTLTGRTSIWRFVWERVRESPWIGHGFASSRIVISSGYATPGGWTAPSAHNLWLQTALDTGLIGALLLTLALLHQAICVWRRASPLGTFALAYVAVGGLTEATLGVTPQTTALVWLLGLFSVLAANRSSEAASVVQFPERRREVPSASRPRSHAVSG